MSKRIYGLDILRAAAVLFVVYDHGALFIKDRVLAWRYGYFSFDGVSIFFVLSGFLIGGILLEIITKPEFTARNLVNFWIRRWFRTLPNYYAVLLLLILSLYLSDQPTPDNLYSYFLFAQNFCFPHPSFFPEAWSLSIEEWFYLLMPLSFYGLIKFLHVPRQSLILAFILTSIFMIVTGRAIYAASITLPDLAAWDLYIRKVVILRLDSLFIGFLAAYVKLYHSRLFFSNANHTFLLGICIFLFDKLQSFSAYQLFYIEHFSLLVNAVAVFLLLPRLTLLSDGNGIVHKCVTFISRISYSMYLLNLTPVQLTVMPLFFFWLQAQFHLSIHSAVLSYLLYWGLTIGAAYVLTKYFEIPVMNFREKFTASKTKFEFSSLENLQRMVGQNTSSKH